MAVGSTWPVGSEGKEGSKDLQHRRCAAGGVFSLLGLLHRKKRHDPMGVLSAKAFQHVVMQHIF